MNKEEIITVFVCVGLIILVYYSMTQCYESEYFDESEYFGGPGGGGGRGGGAGPSQGPGASAAAATTNYYTATPIQFQVDSKLMQQLLTKIIEVVKKYSNKEYDSRTMSINNETMDRVMNVAQTATLKDILQYSSRDVNGMLTVMSSF